MSLLSNILCSLGSLIIAIVINIDVSFLEVLYDLWEYVLVNRFNSMYTF